jgi:glucose/arabinose dehydrogenase
VRTPEVRESRAPLRLERVASAFEAPVQVLAVRGRTYVVEQAGRVRALAGRETLLDLRGLVTFAGEQGLLAAAVHPDDESRLFVHYSDRLGDTIVAEYRDGTRARRLLHVDQPYENHNGGALLFGPDGLLYLGLGDGGDAFDPEGRSQDPGTRLGKLLRLDVDAEGGAWEVVASGLRNPWRAGFDPETGDLWIGDVGQDRWEEVNVLRRGETGVNFGWDVYEGRDRVEEKEPAEGELAFPVAVYGHDAGCSITGGVVDGGRFLVGDFCEGTIWSVGTRDGDLRRERPRLPLVTSFGRGADGEIYLTSQRGGVYRLVR